MNMDLETISVARGGFAARVVTAMKRAKIETLGQIDRMSDEDLTALHGIGAVTLHSIRFTLAGFRKGGFGSAAELQFRSLQGAGA